MGLHVYCIVPAERVPAVDLAGIGGGPVRALVAGPVALWVSPLSRPPAADPAAARTHNVVVQAAMDRVVTPVPSRFGQWFSGEPAAIERVTQDAPRWVALLRRFAGHAEYGVRVHAEVDATAAAETTAAREMHPAQPGSGTQYMAQLARRSSGAQARRNEAGRIEALVRKRAGACIAESRTDTSGSGLVELAHLVAWDDVGAYHSALHAVRADEPALTFRFTGPWPPYSFVG